MLQHAALAVLTTLLAPVDPSPSLVRGQDLTEVYTGDLDHEEGVGAVDWTTTPEDVWRLSSFEYSLRGKFELELGSTTLVIGRSETEKGPSAAWAALFPDEPAVLTTSESGHGDAMEAIFLRFHPGLLGKLFPAKTVEGQGEARWLAWARRQYAGKINACWQWDNMPVVPTKESVVFDMDAQGGKRRMYMLDTKKKKVKYYAPKPIPPAPMETVTPDQAAEVFSQVWQAFDKEYPMFAQKASVDWMALAETYEPLAREARTSYELASVIAQLLANLEDLHVWVQVQGNWVPCFNRFRVTNANWQVVKSQLRGIKEPKGLAYGRTAKGYGYINVWNLSTGGMDDQFDQALEDLADTTGLILDLRWNGGGNELLGRRIAARFLDREVTYSKNQFRSGPDHADLGDVLERKVEPRGPWRYQAPVVALQGEKTMSSAESLALMLAQCPEVTTMGDRTAGSSANPRRLELAYGIVVNLPRWLDMDPEGKPIDAVGIAPGRPIDATLPGNFKEEDPVFEAALAFLRKQGNRKPGKRE